MPAELGKYVSDHCCTGSAKPSRARYRFSCRPGSRRQGLIRATLRRQPQPPASPAPVITGGAIVAGGAALTGSASLAYQASLAAGFYSSQAFLAAASVRDILAVWSQVNLRDVRSSWPALRTALAALIRDRYGQAAMLGQAYYQQARKAADIPGPIHVPAPPLPPDDLIHATLDSTGPYNLLGKIKQGQQVTQATENTGVQMAGAAQRLITNGAGRRSCSRWTRTPRLSRGCGSPRRTRAPGARCLPAAAPVYRSEKTAGFEAHNNWRYAHGTQPVFSRSAAKATHDNPLYQQWQQATKGYGGQDALNAWRRHWDAQQGRNGVIVLPHVG